MNNVDSGKTIEDVKEHRDIKFSSFLSFLSSEQNYHTIKFYQKNLLAIEMKTKTKKQVFMNKPVYLGLSILEISKIGI